MLRNRIAHLFQGLESWNQWQQDIEETFREMASQAISPVQMNLNVWQGDDGALISIAAPGVKPEEVDLNVKGDQLEIKIQRKEPVQEEDYKVHKNEISPVQVEQKLQFPFELNAQQTTARIADGVLFIEVKRHPAYEPKKIEVLAN